MKKIIKILICFLIVIGCSQSDENAFSDFIRGGYVEFENAPTLSFSVLELDTETLSERLIDLNNNAISYSLTLSYNDVVVNDFIAVNSFPGNLVIPISDMTAALGITNEDIVFGETKFHFVATITTPTGTFSGLEYISVNQGGDTTTRLTTYAGIFNALEFDVTFFSPPGKTIRKTSFEEVAVGASDATYVRNGGNTETGDLINGIDPPFVDYTAVGTSVDDELGFDSEYIDVNVSGLSGGFSAEPMGVTAKLDDLDAYTDGVQGFHAEDVDGILRVTFDTVAVPVGQEFSGVTFDAYFRVTSWETHDGIHAFANITTDSGTDVIEIANILDDDVEDREGSWFNINSGYLEGVRSYQLVIEFTCGANAEAIYIDNVVVYELE